MDIILNEYCFKRQWTFPRMDISIAIEMELMKCITLTLSENYNVKVLKSFALTKQMR